MGEILSLEEIFKINLLKWNEFVLHELSIFSVVRMQSIKSPSVVSAESWIKVHFPFAFAEHSCFYVNFSKTTTSTILFWTNAFTTFDLNFWYKFSFSINKQISRISHFDQDLFWGGEENGTTVFALTNWQPVAYAIIMLYWHFHKFATFKVFPLRDGKCEFSTE